MKPCFVIKYSITHFSTQTGLIVIFISISHKGMFPRLIHVIKAYMFPHSQKIPLYT